MGPISEAELNSLVANGTIQKSTLVWHEGLSNWIPYETARPPVLGEPVSGVRYCTECGQPRSEREMVSFGDRVICVNCKDRFTHQLREHGAVGARFHYAGFWIRVVAKLIDAIILYILFIPLSFLLVGAGMFSAGSENPTLSPAFWALQGIAILLQLGISLAYETFFVYKYQATPGKMVVGKKVVMADGSPLTLSRSFARYLCTLISSFTLGIGYIMAAFDDEKRALHDRICDTRVIAK